MPNKVLVAIDGSHCAFQALDVAIREAALRSAFLEILHVVDYGFLKHHQRPTELPSIRAQHVEVSRVLLEKAAKHARDAHVEHSVQLIDEMATLGGVAARIVQYVRDTRPDLVVAGTHGRTGVARLVLGSVAEYLVHQCPVPLLVVRDDMQTATDTNPVLLRASREHWQ